MIEAITLTPAELRLIAATHGIHHAEYVLEQYASQAGRDQCDALYMELAHLCLAACPGCN